MPVELEPEVVKLPPVEGVVAGVVVDGVVASGVVVDAAGVVVDAAGVVAAGVVVVLVAGGVVVVVCAVAVCCCPGSAGNGDDAAPVFVALNGFGTDGRPVGVVLVEPLGIACNALVSNGDEPKVGRLPPNGVVVDDGGMID